jgi:homopolymeric O-antigen transport system permease protein
MKAVYSSKPDSLPEYFKKVWEYRSMILVLSKRDLKIKYAQTSLGLVWTIIQPLTGLMIFTFFFNMLIKLPGIPESGYAVFAFTGMTSWYFFSYIIYQASTSLINGQELAKKIFFPKIILPLSKVLVGLVDFGISMVLLFVLLLIKGIYPGWQILALPFFILLNICVSLSVAIWLSALTIRYRDLQHIIPYLLNFGIWLTPVFFPATLIPEKYGSLLFLNPMAGIVEGFRWSIWEHTDFKVEYFIGIGISLTFLVFGVLYFRKVEDKMIDII